MEDSGMEDVLEVLGLDKLPDHHHPDVDIIKEFDTFLEKDKTFRRKLSFLSADKSSTNIPSISHIEEAGLNLPIISESKPHEDKCHSSRPNLMSFHESKQTSIYGKHRAMFLNKKMKLKPADKQILKTVKEKVDKEQKFFIQTLKSQVLSGKVKPFLLPPSISNLILSHLDSDKKQVSGYPRSYQVVKTFPTCGEEPNGGSHFKLMKSFFGIGKEYIPTVFPKPGTEFNIPKDKDIFQVDFSDNHTQNVLEDPIVSHILENYSSAFAVSLETLKLLITLFADNEKRHFIDIPLIIKENEDEKSKQVFILQQFRYPGAWPPDRCSVFSQKLAEFHHSQSLQESTLEMSHSKKTKLDEESLNVEIDTSVSAVQLLDSLIGDKSSGTKINPNLSRKGVSKEDLDVIAKKLYFDEKKKTFYQQWRLGSNNLDLIVKSSFDSYAFSNKGLGPSRGPCRILGRAEAFGHYGVAPLSLEDLLSCQLDFISAQHAIVRCIHLSTNHSPVTACYAQELTMSNFAAKVKHIDEPCFATIFSRAVEQLHSFLSSVSTQPPGFYLISKRPNQSSVILHKADLSSKETGTNFDLHFAYLCTASNPPQSVLPEFWRGFDTGVVVPDVATSTQKIPFCFADKKS